jgi:hypothetical protein
MPELRARCEDAATTFERTHRHRKDADMNAQAQVVTPQISDADLERLSITFYAMRDAHERVKEAKRIMAQMQRELSAAIAAHEAARVEVSE